MQERSDHQTACRVDANDHVPLCPTAVAVDCTITVNDSLDLLAEFMGCKEEVEALTNSVRLTQALL